MHFFGEIRRRVIDYDTLHGVFGRARDSETTMVVERGPHPASQVVRGNRHVDKAGPRNLDMADDAVEFQVIHHRLGERVRIKLARFRCSHDAVSLIVAMFGTAGGLNIGGGVRAARCREGILDTRVENLEQGLIRHLSEI